MNYIMSTSRVDNSWSEPQPKFLKRVSMCNPAIVIPKIEDIEFDYQEIKNKPNHRTAKCYAFISTKKKVPEKRILWEPTLKPISREGSKSVYPQKLERLPKIKEHPVSSNKPASSKLCGTVLKNIKTPKITNEVIVAKERQSIILTKGSLKLSVNFSSDTLVKFQEVVKSY
ncbi:hypothetical protein NQ314_011371 [Rhamnusium bicolor]|uniref:Uncharacterized protein n=1 Tax=Rhamnusium bicolor TaxID=1586634 RepID=A0AAV8XJ54_9CUCU|nr:hypothetical protein NQ314_011371 [Rhamnusium bicolor]